MIKDVFGLIFAGEENPNLRELVLLRSVAALPVGGRYRAIDFLLSNMVNSGIRNIGVITQKNYQSLMDHVGSGKDWDLSRKKDGLFFLPPFDNVEDTGIYKGICDAIKGSMPYVKRASQQYCLLTGSGTIYTTTYNQMFRVHRDTQADITMLYNVNKERYINGESYKDVRLHTDESGRVEKIECNFAKSKSDKQGMDVYLMRKSLLEYLVDASVAYGNYDFVTDILQKNLHSLRIMAVEHTGYVARLDSVNSYYKMNLDLLQRQVQNDLFYTGNPVYTKIKDEAPVKYLEYANTSNSLLANGCVINGEVTDSVLFRAVKIAKGATVKGCILMQETEVDINCHLENVIVDKKCHFHAGSRLVGSPSYPIVIRKDSVI